MAQGMNWHAADLGHFETYARDQYHQVQKDWTALSLSSAEKADRLVQLMVADLDECRQQAGTALNAAKRHYADTIEKIDFLLSQVTTRRDDLEEAIRSYDAPRLASPY